jgi:hypothetical protein
MKKTFVTTLKTGAVFPTNYGIDENGQVFRVGDDGEAYEVSEEVAAEVRAQVKSGKDPSPSS